MPADFGKLQRGTLPDQIVATLRRQIASNVLAPGMRLPPETELAESFGVGRGTVREAIKALTLMRLLERNTTGTYVASSASLYADDDLVGRMMQEDPDFTDLYEARAMLEAHIVRLACERATEHDLKMLKQALDRAEKAPTTEKALAADLDYHHALAEAAHNSVLLHLYMLSMEAIARAYKAFLLIFTDEQASTWGHANHRAIVEAIRTKDADRAESIARESINKAAKALFKALQESKQKKNR